TALDLALHVTGMDRLPGILHGRVAQDGDFPSLRVHLDIDNMGSNRRPGPTRVDSGAARDRTASGILACRDLLESELFVGVLHMIDSTVPILVLLAGALPGARSPGAHLPLNFLRRLIGDPPRFKRHAAAAGVRGEANGIGVSNRRIDILDRNTQHFGQLLRPRGTRATDIGRAFDQLNPAIRVHNCYRTGGTRPIAPEPTGDTTATV